MNIITEIGLRWTDGDIINFAGVCEGCGDFEIYGGFRNFGICCI